MLSQQVFNPGKYCLPADVFSFAVLTWELFSTATITAASGSAHGQGLAQGQGHGHGQDHDHGHGTSTQAPSSSSSMGALPPHASSKKVNPVCGLDPYEATGKLEQGIRPAYSAGNLFVSLPPRPPPTPIRTPTYTHPHTYIHQASINTPNNPHDDLIHHYLPFTNRFPPIFRASWVSDGVSGHHVGY